ncbi:MAG: DNA-directed RNA polymerase subunit H [Candidatus Woesearchaeota archaeon]
MKTIKHELVPEHIKISESEKKELLEKYKISLNELPRILKNDPAIAHLNVKEGDVIKIIRKSESAGQSVYYRVVVYE